jgi:hypothetical protein
MCVCARKRKVKQQMKLNVKEQKGLTSRNIPYEAIVARYIP